jgi:hypothetical protein
MTSLYVYNDIYLKQDWASLGINTIYEKRWGVDEEVNN